MLYQRHHITPTWMPIVFLAVVAATLAACAPWQPQWPPEEPQPLGPDIKALLETAEHYTTAADSQEGLQAAVDAYTMVLERAPYHQKALTDLANLTILMGTAHTNNREEKNRLFLRAMRLCERAMVVNPEFRTLIGRGLPPWRACHVLTETDMPAMMFWCTAVLYRFKEVFSFPEQVLNLSWVEHIGPFLTRMEAVDPQWGGGAIQFTRSLYFGILPRLLGGDAEKSRLYLEQAIAYGPPWMLSRWGRAKYFHVRDKNRKGFEQDLRWILEQDVSAPGEAYYWRVYFRQDARDMLNEANRYFR